MTIFSASVIDDITLVPNVVHVLAFIKIKIETELLSKYTTHILGTKWAFQSQNHGIQKLCNPEVDFKGLGIWIHIGIGIAYNIRIRRGLLYYGSFEFCSYVCVIPV